MQAMSDEQVNRSIEAIDRAVHTEDPAFVRRFVHVQRAETTAAIAVFALLASSAVLLAAGLAIHSWVIFAAGAVALLASIAVDEHHKRVRRRSLGRRDGRIKRFGRRLADLGGRLLGGASRRIPGPGWTWPARQGGDQHSWSQRVVLDSNLAEVSTHLREPADVAMWFPGVRRVPHDDGTDIVIGEHGETRLRVTAERWIPGAGGTLEATADDATIAAHLAMRTVLVPADHTGTVRSGVEIEVHAETNDSRRAGRVLRRLESVTTRGLRHMKAELSRR